MCFVPIGARAQVPVQRTRFELPSSNGHGAIVVALDHADPARARRVVQLREHPYSAEEPVLDAAMAEVWNGSGFAAVHTRDVLYDAYFGLRGPGGSVWLPDAAIDLDASGYLGIDDASPGGTGIVVLEQSWNDLHATTHVFAPMDLPHAAMAMVLRVRNDGDTTANDVQAFSLHNVHLGFGRPESSFAVGTDIASNGETLEHVDDGTSASYRERGFAGVVVARTLGPIAHYGTAPGQNPYAIVQAGGELGDNAPSAGAVDDAVGAWQLELGDLSPGEEAWVGLVLAHHGDPFAADDVDAWLDTWIAGRDAEQIVADERAAWGEHIDGLVLPDGDAYEAALVRQSAAMLRMGQVRETSTYLREWLDEDGNVRRTRLPSLEDPASLPAEVEHRGQGAVLASLPPGNWTYAWIRDGAYAISAMAALGMHAEASAGLEFYLDAESGRFVDWQELADYDMPPYLVTLVRYLGFGVEETDFNDFGPNLEFDGFGLFLWALRNYVEASGDETVLVASWDRIAGEVADPIIALVESDTGLLRPDSSIWETHWNGRERHWAYTNITAARGLCDAAELALRVGDDARATAYRDAGIALRAAIAARLLDRGGALASNTEELASGGGYHDAAVLDAIAMGLFDPEGEIAQATLAALDEHLLTEASEVGWSRNDDRYDHGGGEDLSPWGSDYDSAEWVVTDLRGAIAARAGGDATRSDAILQWITAQATVNYGMMAETFHEQTGVYEFNTPMLGFGAGAYVLALAHREGAAIDPACGAYFEDEGGTDTGDTSEGGTADESGTADATGTASESSGTSASGDASPSGSVGTDGGQLDTSGSGDEGSMNGDGGGCGCDVRDSDAGWLALGLLALVRRRRRGVLAAALVVAACGDDGVRAVDESSSSGDVVTTITPTATDPSATTGPSTTATDATLDTSAGPGSASESSTGDPTGGMEVDVCPTRFAFADDSAAIQSVRVAGEWQGFDLPTAPALEDGDGWEGTVDLPPGLWAYKLVVEDGDGVDWILDPEQTRRKYVDELENSAVLVPDCNLPSFAVDDHAASGDGSFTAAVRYVDGAPGDGPDTGAFVATLRHDFDERELTEGELVVDDAGDLTIALEDLPAGKHTLVLRPADRGGRIGLPLRMPFWIEPEPFDWNGALIYMVMTDRFVNGVAGNDPGPTPGADGRGDYWGGDLQGLAQAIEDGTLDALGVRAIWVSPFNTNPDGAYLASDGVHLVTGYHGYWPVSGRGVEPRIGGGDALRQLVASAHAHGIRVLQDFVINHVHEEHEYVALHPEWFRTGCVCGTNGCDWTVNALECTFTPYLPDIDHRVPEANAQFVDDAVFWLDEYDLDGLRVDAVKHVEEAATRNLAAAVREGFENAGTRYFLMGETAMGWNDCADPCNDENYGTISRYVGPHGLDGQFDFVLYHGVSYRVFAYGDNGMLHADYWLQHGLDKWPEGAIMTPYIGSHDTPRFVTLADYRGQDGAHARGVAFNQWNDTAWLPGDEEPFRRARIGFAWLLGLPGAPLMYYGDEYGQWGGADPNNRAMWREGAALGDVEQETLDFVRALGQARRDTPALRTGGYLSLGATDDTLVFARTLEVGDPAIVGLTRNAGATEQSVSVVQLGLDPGTVLHDLLGGPDAVVGGGGTLDVQIPGSGAVVLVP